MLREYLGEILLHSPERSDLPSGVRGAGAERFGLPSAVRGIPTVGCFNHCAERGEPNKTTIVDRRPQRAGATRDFIGYLQATYGLSYLDGHPIKKDPPYKEPAACSRRAQHRVCYRSAFRSAPAYPARTNRAAIANRLRSLP